MTVNQLQEDTASAAAEAPEPPEIPRNSDITPSNSPSSDQIDVLEALDRLTISDEYPRITQPTPDTQSHLNLVARSRKEGQPGMDDGAIAGVTIGVIIALALLIFCIYPFVVRSIRRRRDARRPPSDVEVATAIDPTGPPSAAFIVASRPRNASNGSFKETPRGISHWPVEQGLGLPQANGHHEQLPEMAAVPGGMTPTQSMSLDARTESDAVVTMPFPNYDGEFFPASTHDAQPGVLKGTSADYYSPDIPSEAFGMVTKPEDEEPQPAELNRSERSMSRGSSLRRNVKQMFRHKSTRDRTMSGSDGQTSRGPSASFQQDRSMLPTILTEHPSSGPGLATSPTDIHAEPHHLPNIHVPQNGAVTTPPLSSPTGVRKAPSPPSHPAPGTVNPMDIMPATTFSEMSYKTEYQLENYETASQQQSTAHVPEIEFPSDGPSPHTTADTPSDQQAYSPPALAVSNSDLSPIREPADEDMTEDHEIPHHTYLHPNGMEPNGRHPSSASDVSTPLPGPASTVPSSQNTPSTALDSPSPQSIGGSSGYRHSTSPPMIMGATPPMQTGQSPPMAMGAASPKTGHFRCEEVGCSQTFDQPHKLKHHQRYHAKEHKCQYPGCGKGFGTKTHLQRHINDRHEKKKKFHCAIPDCDYSRAGGRAFPRKDNWKRHMTKIHGMEQHNLPEPEEVDQDMAGV